jgi:putative hemolysin
VTTPEIIAWSLLTFCGLVGSAIWSGTETGFYCLSRVRLDVRLHRRNDTAARRVRDELDNPNRLLSTILLGNNICNYLGTLGLTMLLEGAGLGPGLTVLLQMVVLTPVFLIFGESLPKEVFRLNADSWPYALAPVVRFVRTIATVTLVLPALMLVSRLALRLAGERSGTINLAGQRRLLGLLEESAHAGSISGVQGALAERALVFERTRVGEVMIPWRRVDRIRLDWSNEQATEFALRTTRTWLPVTDRLGRVRAVIHAIDLVRAEGDLGGPDGPEMVEPLLVRTDESVRTAIGRLASHPAGIAIVEAGGKPVGVVGRHDLVRPLIGRPDGEGPGG